MELLTMDDKRIPLRTEAARGMAEWFKGLDLLIELSDEMEVERAGKRPNLIVCNENLVGNNE